MESDEHLCFRLQVGMYFCTLTIFFSLPYQRLSTTQNQHIAF